MCTSPLANPILPGLQPDSVIEEIPHSNHLGAGAALRGSTSQQLLDEGVGTITGCKRGIEVYASSLGERFYCDCGTGLKGIRVRENESQPSLWKSCFAFRGSPGGF